jgi:repressor LexA
VRSLTDKQKSVLDFIEGEIRTRRQPPTIKEIARHIGSENTRSGLTHLEALIRKGFLERSPGQARSIRLTGTALALYQESAEGAREIPYFTARPSAEGKPSFLPLPSALFDRPPDFALEVGPGRSLPEAEIREGDILFAQKITSRDREEIVVVRDPGSGELLPGRLVRRKDRFLLRSPSPGSPEQDLRKTDLPSLIQGRVVAQFRILRGIDKSFDKTEP